MSAWTRRRLLGALSSLAVAGLPGCARPFLKPSPPAPAPGGLPPLIDAHCHLFNATDLPVARFAQIVLLKDYQHRGPQKWWERALAAALRDIEDLLQGGVLRASEEANPEARPLLEPTMALSADAEMKLKQRQRDAERALAASDGMDAAAACKQSGKLSPSLESIVGWIRTLRSSRAGLTAALRDANAASGYQSSLLCPALVDYSNWIEEDLASPLPDQVRALGTLAARADLPPVHGYVAFDPLRAALLRHGSATLGGSWDPFRIAEEALLDNGFLGVKLYPPMGFRPGGNAGSRQGYPPRIEDTFGGSEAVSAALDEALEDLWAFCLKHDAPVLAHAANSVGAGPDYSRRADPAYWLPVATKHPELRILLAHFGRFDSYSAGHERVDDCDPPFGATWEAAFGRFVAERRDCRLYADISYLSDIFTPKDRARARRGMEAYLKLDPGGRHLVYGSDWVMLGIEKAYPGGGGYPHRVARFLAECGLSPGEVRGIMRDNAIRCLGLTAESGARKRILSFYAKNGLPAARLPG